MWEARFDPQLLPTFEALVGDLLEDLGYPLATTNRRLLQQSNLKRKRAIYQKYFDAKLWLKSKTPLRQLLITNDLSWL